MKISSEIYDQGLIGYNAIIEAAREAAQELGVWSKNCMGNYCLCTLTADDGCHVIQTSPKYLVTNMEVTPKGVSITCTKMSVEDDVFAFGGSNYEKVVFMTIPKLAILDKAHLKEYAEQLATVYKKYNDAIDQAQWALFKALGPQLSQ